MRLFVQIEGSFAEMALRVFCANRELFFENRELFCRNRGLVCGDKGSFCGRMK